MKISKINTFSAAKWKDYPKLLPESKGRNIRFYNYIKSKNITHTFYHGTASSFYDKILQTGFIISPVAGKTEKYEQRQKGLNQIFYTTSATYASYYSNRASEQSGSQPLILVLKIPLYMITEVNSVLLNPEKFEEIYNEYNLQFRIKTIVEEHLSLGKEQVIFDQIITSINSEIEDFFNKKKEDEYTTLYMIPSKFITGVIKDVGLALLTENAHLFKKSLREWDNVSISDMKLLSNPKKINQLLIRQLNSSVSSDVMIRCVHDYERRQEIGFGGATGTATSSCCVEA